MRKYEPLTDTQLADAIAQKSAMAHTERSAAALLGTPARLATAKRTEEEIAELRAEQSRRSAAGREMQSQFFKDFGIPDAECEIEPAFHPNFRIP